jgi:transcriptional regulator with XRE-family HTH domain
MGGSQSPDSSNNSDRRIGARLVLALAKRDVSAERLAVSLNIGQRLIYCYCTGEERIPAALLLQISQFLDVPVAWFFTDDDQE